MKKLSVLFLALAVTFGSAGCTRKTLSDIVNENNGGTENNVLWLNSVRLFIFNRY